jgi:hypothetical protein
MSPISNFTKIHPMGAELIHAETDRRVDMTKIIVAFAVHANGPKKFTREFKKPTEWFRCTYQISARRGDIISTLDTLLRAFA